MLFEQIISGPTKRSENLQFLKNTDCAVVMFGIAQAAKWTTAMLQKNGIKVDAYCVSNDFWKPDLKFGDIPVSSCSEIYRKYDKAVVILAVGSNRKKLREEILSHKQVSACLEFDCPTVSETYDRDQMLPYREALENLYSKLEDDFSRQTMTVFLNERISGDLDSLCSVDRPEKDQYFPEFVSYSRQETVVDCGAFIGDTLEMFLKNAGGFKRYFAFECDPENFGKLHSKFGGKDNIILLPYGVSDSDRIAYVDFDGGSDSRISDSGKNAIKLTTIDRVIAEHQSDCTFIKMDVEGAELAALHGAEQTIRKYRPKLAICVYHKAEDLWTIPQYILSLHPDYKLYLRKYASPFSCELVLYAI